MTEPARSTHDPTPRWSARIHESLDAHEAQAAELRRELDDVRRSLKSPDDEPTVGLHRRPRRRPPIRVLVVLVVVIALAAAGLTLLARGRGAPASSTPAPRATAGTKATSAAAGGTPSAGSVTAGAHLPAWPGLSVAEPPGLPATGPGASAPGSEITAAIDPDRRHVEVYERALLAPGTGTLTLRPAQPPAAARELVTGPPGVQDLHAEVDGRPATVTSGPDSWTVTAPADAQATRVVLRYTLNGALVRRVPSPVGRYTLVLRPLTPSAGRGAGDAVVVRLRDPRVEEVYCLGAADQLCGATSDDLHTATVPRGAPAVVIGLVTLPPS
jgi:hypothetical protein